MSLSKVKMLQVSKCLIGLAVMVLQSCEVADERRDKLCGNWESVDGKPDVLVYKEGEAYKVTVFKRSGLRRKLKPETYLLQEENGNLFMNTGFRIDVSYNEAADVLTFSPNGDYIRVKDFGHGEGTGICDCPRMAAAERRLAQVKREPGKET